MGHVAAKHQHVDPSVLDTPGRHRCIVCGRPNVANGPLVAPSTQGFNRTTLTKDDGEVIRRVEILGKEEINDGGTQLAHKLTADALKSTRSARTAAACNDDIVS